MKLCISELTTLPVDLTVDLPAFAGTGWTAVELSIEKADRYLADHSIEELRQLLDASGLRAVAAIGLAPTGPGLFLARGADADRYFASLRRQLAICRDLGIACLGIGADPGNGAANKLWWPGAVENVRHAGELAAEYDVKIGIESLSLGPPIGPFLLESLDETRRFVEAVDHAAVGINFDVFHFIRSGGTVADILATKPGQIVHVHICDLPDMPSEQWEDGHRLMPGAGGLPLAAYGVALREAHYDGYWALELLNEDLWKADPAKVAQIGFASMTAFAAEISRS
jgi:sugar phosphate isomerase/epimerase